MNIEFEIVFGFKQGDTENCIRIECFDGIDECFGIFATDVVDGFMKEAVYGVICNFNSATGVVNPPTKKYEKLVKCFYEKYKNYYLSKGINISSTIGYYKVINGDFKNNKRLYAPFAYYEKQEWDK